MDEYITYVELMSYLKISRDTINRWRKEGMPAEKIGKGVRFKKEEVMQWIREHKNKN